MPYIRRLPRPEDGDEGLFEFFTKFTPAERIQFIRMVRQTRSEHRDSDPAGEITDQAAAQMIKQRMQQDPSLTYQKARLDVAHELGFQGTNITHFNKIANRGWARLQDET